MNKGKIISVWSNVKRTGKTMFIYNLLKNLTKESEKASILVIDVNFKHGNLMSMFGNKNDIYFESLMNTKLMNDDVINYKDIIFRKDNIWMTDLLVYDITYSKSNLKKYIDTISDMATQFDIVLIDVINDSENPLTNMLLENSESIINVINQDKEALDNGFKTNKDAFYIVSNYNKDIYPNNDDLKKLYELDKEKVFTLPNCPILADMKNRGQLNLYEGTEYALEVKKISEFLVNYFGLPKEDKKEEKKKGFFGLFK